MTGEADRPPVTRPAGRAAFAWPLVPALPAGVAAGVDPATALVVVAAAVSGLVLVWRVDRAALALLVGVVFQDYLARISPHALVWLVAVLLVAWVVRRAQGRLHPHRLRLVALPGLALAAVAVVSYAAHPLGLPGLWVLVAYVLLVAVTLVLADCLCGPLPPRRAARVYVLACVAAAVCGLLTAVLSDRHRVVGPVANADAFAFLLVAAAPLVGTVRSRPDQPVWWVWGSFATLTVAGVGTQSRSALLALLGMVLVAVATRLLSPRYAGALLGVVATLAALVVTTLPLPVGQALSDPQRYADASLAQRQDARAAALAMTEAAPLLGMGPAAYPLLHRDYLDADDDAAPVDVDTAYSTLLETSAELGVLGGLALYATWLLPAVGLVRRWREHRSPLRGGVLLALVGLLTASVGEARAVALPLWFLAALSIGLGRPHLVRTPLPGPPPERSPSGQVALRS